MAEEIELAEVKDWIESGADGAPKFHRAGDKHGFMRRARSSGRTALSAMTANLGVFSTYVLSITASVAYFFAMAKLTWLPIALLSAFVPVSGPIAWVAYFFSFSLGNGVFLAIVEKTTVLDRFNGLLTRFIVFSRGKWWLYPIGAFIGLRLASFTWRKRGPRFEAKHPDVVLDAASLVITGLAVSAGGFKAISCFSSVMNVLKTAKELAEAGISYVAREEEYAAAQTEIWKAGQKEWMSLDPSMDLQQCAAIEALGDFWKEKGRSGKGNFFRLWTTEARAGVAWDDFCRSHLRQPPSVKAIMTWEDAEIRARAIKDAITFDMRGPLVLFSAMFPAVLITAVAFWLWKMHHVRQLQRESMENLDIDLRKRRTAFARIPRVPYDHASFEAKARITVPTARHWVYDWTNHIWMDPEKLDRYDTRLMIDQDSYFNWIANHIDEIDLDEDSYADFAEWQRDLKASGKDYFELASDESGTYWYRKHGARVEAKYSVSCFEAGMLKKKKYVNFQRQGYEAMIGRQPFQVSYRDCLKNWGSCITAGTGQWHFCTAHVRDILISEGKVPESAFHQVSAAGIEPYQEAVYVFPKPGDVRGMTVKPLSEVELKKLCEAHLLRKDGSVSVGKFGIDPKDGRHDLSTDVGDCNTPVVIDNCMRALHNYTSGRENYAVPITYEMLEKVKLIPIVQGNFKAPASVSITQGRAESATLLAPSPLEARIKQMEADLKAERSENKALKNKLYETNAGWHKAREALKKAVPPPPPSLAPPPPAQTPTGPSEQKPKKIKVAVTKVNKILGSAAAVAPTKGATAPSVQ